MCHGRMVAHACAVRQSVPAAGKEARLARNMRQGDALRHHRMCRKRRKHRGHHGARHGIVRRGGRAALALRLRVCRHYNRTSRWRLAPLGDGSQFILRYAHGLNSNLTTRRKLRGGRFGDQGLACRYMHLLSKGARRLHHWLISHPELVDRDRLGTHMLPRRYWVRSRSPAAAHRRQRLEIRHRRRCGVSRRLLESVTAADGP